MSLSQTEESLPPSSVTVNGEKRHLLVYNDSTLNKGSSLKNSSGEKEIPDRTFCQLLRHGSQQFVLDCAFSCESTLGAPLLLILGIPQSLYGILGVSGAIMGAVLGLFLGPASDNCTCRWGRRRPFLLALNIAALIGSACYLNGENIASTVNTGWALAAVIIGTTLVDSCSFQTDAMSRAYLLDVCNLDDVNRGLIIRAVLGGVGCGCGFAIIGVDWESTSLGPIFGSNYMVILVFQVLLYVIVVSLSLTSIPEVPLNETENIPLNDLPLNCDVTHRDSTSVSAADAREEDNTETSPTFTDRLWSFIYMPSVLRWLCLAEFLGWASFTLFMLYFSDFFAHGVYHGDPVAPHNSTAYLNYKAGIRMASWGLCIFGFSAAVVSLLFLKITSYVSLKTLFVVCPLIWSVSAGLMAVLTQYPIAVMVLCASCAVFFVCLMTVPFDILAIYHHSPTYIHPPSGIERGKGTDMSLIYVMVFLAQVISSLLIGPFVFLTGSRLTVVIVSSISAFLLSLCAAFGVTYEL